MIEPARPNCFGPPDKIAHLSKMLEQLYPFSDRHWRSQWAIPPGRMLLYGDALFCHVDGGEASPGLCRDWMSG